MKKEVTVKGFYRKGRYVRTHKSKRTARDKVLKGAVLAAGIVGIGATTFLLARVNYINKLDKFASALKAGNDGQKLAGNYKSITFTFGGFTNPEQVKNSSTALAEGLKKQLSVSERQQHFFVPVFHQFTPNIRFGDKSGIKPAIEFMFKSVRTYLNSVVNGRNETTLKEAQTIYDWASKNPGKTINLVGHSGGTNIAKDIAYILERKGIKNKLVMMGHPNFYITPTSKATTLDLYTDLDFVKPWASGKSQTVITPAIGVAAHKQTGYTENKTIMNKTKRFLYE